MKKIIIILISLLSAYCYGMNTSGNFPEAQFKSINCANMNNCSTYSSHISNVGALNVYDDNSYSESNLYKPGPRRVHPGDDPGDPYQTPIGDIPIILFLGLCSLYIVYRNKYKKLKNII